MEGQTELTLEAIFGLGLMTVTLIIGRFAIFDGGIEREKRYHV